jgi:hypothetical protein
MLSAALFFGDTAMKKTSPPTARQLAQGFEDAISDIRDMHRRFYGREAAGPLSVKPETFVTLWGHYTMRAQDPEGMKKIHECYRRSRGQLFRHRKARAHAAPASVRKATARKRK